MVKISRIPAAPLRPDPGSWADDRLTAAWLGHATVLLNFHGTWILTDPVLVWPSELALSDIRRPPPVGLLGPLLTHWGLRLEASEMRGLYA